MMIPNDIPEDCRQLWHKVAECIEVVNALQNMTVRVEGRLRMTGKLTVSDGSAQLVIEEPTQTGDLGN
jgi:hypothetical protein